MYVNIGTARNGKVIIQNGLEAQVDDNGAAALISNHRNWMATRDEIESMLGVEIDVEVIDEHGSPCKENLKPIHRVGARGKKFTYYPAQSYLYTYKGSPVIRNSVGTAIFVDQYGAPRHPGAYKEKQYYSMDGELVTLTNAFTVKEVLEQNLRMPIFIRQNDKRVATLSFQKDRYAIADMEGKCLIFDQSGIAIDDARVMKYEKLIRGVINKTLPLKQCVEGSYFYEDLIAVGYATIVRSLIKCDSDKALTTVSSTSKRKKVTDAERLKYKQENPELAIAQCEENWVQQALFNEFRRLAWKHSEKEKGGRAVSMSAAARRNAVRVDEDGSQIDINAMMEDCGEPLFDKTEEFASISLENEEIESIIGHDETPDTILMNANQASADMEFLLEFQEKCEGFDSVTRETMLRDEMRKLPVERQEDLSILLRNIKSGVSTVAVSDEEIEDRYEQAQIRSELESQFVREEESDNDEE